MINIHTAPYAALVLRVSLGAMFIVHSVWLKLFVFTLPGTAQFFGSIGLPPTLAYIVFAMEALGGIALILGVATRGVALALIPILIGATWAHAGNGWLFTNTGGGWEYPLFLTLATLVHALLGDGAYALRMNRTGGLPRAQAARA
ncbi:MAG: DoxX family protein [Burkholderiales bacterium]